MSQQTHNIILNKRKTNAILCEARYSKFNDNFNTYNYKSSFLSEKLAESTVIFEVRV